MQIALRRLAPGDLPQGTAVLEVAYGRPGAWGEDLALHLGLDPDLWFGAEVGRQLAGLGGATRYGTVAWIGLMAVKPIYGRRGLGAMILDHILAAVRERGATTSVLDASAAGEPLYLSRGFEDYGSTGLFELDRPAPNAPVHGVDRIGRDDLEAAAALDASLFGPGRTRALAALLGDPATDAFAAWAGARISGYVMVHGRRIGPWLAERAEDAERLLAAALSRPLSAAPTLMIPGENKGAEELARRAGFVERRRLRHMALGSPAPSRTGIYGQGSFSLG